MPPHVNLTLSLYSLFVCYMLFYMLMLLIFFIMMSYKTHMYNIPYLLHIYSCFVYIKIICRLIFLPKRSAKLRVDFLCQPSTLLFRMLYIVQYFHITVFPSNKYPSFHLLLSSFLLLYISCLVISCRTCVVVSYLSLASPLQSYSVSWSGSPLDCSLVQRY